MCCGDNRPTKSFPEFRGREFYGSCPVKFSYLKLGRIEPSYFCFGSSASDDGLIAGLSGFKSNFIIWQISNQTTLGKIEENLVDHLETMIRRVIGYEHEARQVVMKDGANITEDRVWRAYGLLKYSRSLSFAELMSLLSRVRLGIGLKLLPDVGVYTLNKIMLFTQRAHLEEAAGRPLTSTERNLYRATYVRKALNAKEA